MIFASRSTVSERPQIFSRRGVAEVVGLRAARSSCAAACAHGAVYDGSHTPRTPEPFNTFATDSFDRWVDDREAWYRAEDRKAGSYEETAEVYEELPEEVQPYYRELSGSGDWSYIDDYGYVWTPRGIATGWRPYRNGHWSYGPRGYFWVSNDPWGWAPYHYGLLAAGADIDGLAEQLPALAQRHMGADRTATRSLHAESLTDIRLHSGRMNELTPTSDNTYVYLFSVIAFFILLLACINFMNLATARATERAREVGMRKALGARRAQLVGQFLGESMILALLALVLMVVLVEALLPAFNALAGKTLTAGALLHWSVPLVLGGAVVFVGVLAGGYPAFVLSSFRPARVLKGPVRAGHGATLRKGLVVFQFALSIVLVVSTLVVYRQLDFVRNERLGFDKEHVVLVPLRDVERQMNHRPLKEAWLRLPGVRHVTASSGMPGLNDGLHDFMIKPEGAAGDSLELMTLTVDHDYVETYGLEVIAGRDFSEAFSTDATEAFLLNESAARRLGWTDPVGRRLTLRVWFNGEMHKQGAVIGVVRDFQYASLRQAIDPTILHILPESYYNDYLSVRLHPDDVPGTLAELERTWARLIPDRPFEFRFLDQTFDTLYQVEARVGRLFGVFTGLALLIACLGLFGLAAFTAEQRTREIGIRKVLGASVGSVVLLLSHDQLKLIAVAFVVGAPLAYVSMSRWLDGFVYHVALSGRLFLLAGLIVVLVALLTVSYQAARAALSDPVHSLRHE